MTPAAPPAKTGRPLVALGGNPNAGKTTLFNALTGSRARVGNYPGVTVEKRVGELDLSGLAPGSGMVSVLDVPGT
jgi:ferrous iron transport protein B